MFESLNFYQWLFNFINFLTINFYYLGEGRWKQINQKMMTNLVNLVQVKAIKRQALINLALSRGQVQAHGLGQAQAVHGLVPAKAGNC